MAEYEASILYNVEVVAAVEYLHDQGVTHNDIKDENIIVERWGLLPNVSYCIIKVDVWRPLVVPVHIHIFQEPFDWQYKI